MIIVMLIYLLLCLSHFGWNFQIDSDAEFFAYALAILMVVIVETGAIISGRKPEDIDVKRDQ